MVHQCAPDIFATIHSRNCCTDTAVASVLLYSRRNSRICNNVFVLYPRNFHCAYRSSDFCCQFFFWFTESTNAFRISSLHEYFCIYVYSNSILYAYVRSAAVVRHPNIHRIYNCVVGDIPQIATNTRRFLFEKIAKNGHFSYFHHWVYRNAPLLHCWQWKIPSRRDIFLNRLLIDFCISVCVKLGNMNNFIWLFDLRWVYF